MSFEDNTVTKLSEEENPIKPIFTLDSSDKIFALFAALSSVFTSIFGFFGGFSLGYFLSLALMLILFLAYFMGNKRMYFPAVLYGLLSLASSAAFICTSNSSVRFFATVISFLLSLLCFNGIIYGKISGNKNTLSVFSNALYSTANISVSLRSIFSNHNGNKKSIAKALVGLACALPVLVVVLPLLLSSDAAFKGMMSSIFNNTFSTLAKTAVGIFASVFVISYGFSLKKDKIKKASSISITQVENIYIVSFLSAIGFCYLLYLFSQLAYFFSAFRGFLPNGEITYAEYARKGFFEMCIIAVINLLIAFVVMLISKKDNGRICNTIKALCTFIAIFTLIIIATAISKMVLYIAAYGMTVLRITTSSFMLFLSIVFISVILKIYFRKINVVKTGLIAAGFILFALGAINVNAVCAEYNYNSYKNGNLKSIDVYALYELGDEGIPSLIKLADCNDKAVSETAQQHLAQAYIYDYFDNMQHKKHFDSDDLKQNQKYKGFKYYTLPRAKAYKELYKFIEEKPYFSSACNDIIFNNEQSSY